MPNFSNITSSKQSGWYMYIYMYSTVDYIHNNLKHTLSYSLNVKYQLKSLNPINDALYERPGHLS